MLIDDIADFLEDEGIGTVGTDIFVGHSPDDEDVSQNIISVIDTGGTTPDPYLPTHEPTFQVFVRNTSFLNGKNKLEAVRSALHRTGDTTIGSTKFMFILAISEGGSLGKDEVGRELFSINFRCRTRDAGN